MTSSTKEESPKYGYCAVTCDYIHAGHIEFLKACSEKCQKLIVGIMVDDEVNRRKGKYPIIRDFDRKILVESIRYVYFCIYQQTFEFDKNLLAVKERMKGDFIIIDSDEHSRQGADIIIPGGKNRRLGLSSTRHHENLNHS